MAKVARVEQELVPVLDRALTSRRRRHGVEAARQPLDDVEELERAERLAQVRVGAGVALDGRVAHRAREQDDGNVRCARVRLQAPAELGSAHAREPNVQHDRVRPAQAHGLERGFGRPDVFHLDVHDLESRAEQCPERGVVVDDEQTHWRLS